MNQKKSQMKIMEMIFVLIIFFFLFIMAVIFYAKVSRFNTRMSLSELQKYRLLYTTQRIQNFPELQCSFDGTLEENCIDELKLESFISSMTEEKQKTYDVLLSKSEIELIQTYPEEASWVIYKDSRIGDNIKGAIASLMPTTIYYPLTHKYAFGYLKVSIITRQ